MKQLIEAAAAARALLSKLSARLEIDEDLHAEISRAEETLWGVLFPGSQQPKRKWVFNDEGFESQTDDWARIVERLDKMGARAADHLSLAEGDKVVVVFLGEPWAYEAAWHDERKQWVPVHRSPVPVDPALRIRINVYIPATGKLKWWEMDTATFQSLYTCRDKYGLDKWMFEVEAVDVSPDGACGTYSILPEAKLDAPDLARIACRPLFQWGEDA